MKSGSIRTRPRGIARETALLSVVRLVSLLLSVILPLLLVRRISQTDFGLYKQSFQILGTVLSLLALQVSATAYTFMMREPERRQQVALNIIWFYVLTGLLTALVFYFFPDWIGRLFQDSSLVIYFPLLGLVTWLWLIASPFQTLMIANDDVPAAAVLTVTLQILKTILFILAVIIVTSLWGLLLAGLVFGFMQCAAMILWLRYRFGTFAWQPDVALFRLQLANALPFGAGSFVYALQAEMHNYFVAYSFSPAEYAIYATGCFQIVPLTLLLDSAHPVLTREVARLHQTGNHQAIIELWFQTIRRMALVFVPTCFFLLAFRHEFITVLFTQNYDAATPVFAISLIQTLLLIVMQGSLLRAFDEFRYFYLKLFLLLLPLTGLAIWTGIRLAGLTGAIAAVVGIRLIEQSVTITQLWQKLKIKASDLKNLSGLLLIVATAAAAAILTISLRLLLPQQSDLLLLLTGSTVFSFLYLLLLLNTTAITRTERESLRRIMLDFRQTVAAAFRLSPATRG